MYHSDVLMLLLKSVDSTVPETAITTISPKGPRETRNLRRKSNTSSHRSIRFVHIISLGGLFLPRYQLKKAATATATATNMKLSSAIQMLVVVESHFIPFVRAKHEEVRFGVGARSAAASLSSLVFVLLLFSHYAQLTQHAHSYAYPQSGRYHQETSRHPRER